MTLWLIGLMVVIYGAGGIWIEYERRKTRRVVQETEREALAIIEALRAQRSPQSNQN